VEHVLNATGFNYEYLKQFIPYPLTPNDWESWSLHEQRNRVEARKLLFSWETYQNFIHHICQNVYTNHEIIQSMKMVTSSLQAIYEVILKMDDYLFNFSELMTLSDLATELNYQKQTLYNNLKRQTEKEDDIEIGYLEIPGFKFKMRKVKGEWTMSRYEFYHQYKKLGFRKVMIYGGHWSDDT